MTAFMVIFGASSFMFCRSCGSEVTNLVKIIFTKFGPKSKVDLNKRFKCKFSKTTPDSKRKQQTQRKSNKRLYERFITRWSWWFTNG